MNALLKVEATKCEVCNVQRALPKEDLPGSDVLASSDSDIPLVNSEVIKVKLILLFCFLIALLSCFKRVFKSFLFDIQGAPIFSKPEFIKPCA